MQKPITATECIERNAAAGAAIDEAFRRTAAGLEFGLLVEYAGILLREAELEDIEHYFVYTADDWAEYALECA